jgi:two-component system sensor histidine kinase ChvG
MSVILDDVSRLDRLISDISDASRLDAELSREETEPVDVGQLLEALVEVYATVVAKYGLRLELKNVYARDLVVLGIEGRLGQVFRNIISNALSFSPPGGVIQLSARRDGREVVTAVSDEGPGIPEGKQQEIFARFYSERPTGEKFGTHSGLGLSISKQIVEAHGGTIRAENCVDRQGRVIGARFIIRLPSP